MSSSLTRIASASVVAASLTLAIVVGTLVAHLARIANGVESGALAGPDAALELRITGTWLALSGVSFVGLLVLIAVHANDMVNRPLSALTRKVDSIGEGAFSERVPEQGPREVKELARAVNRMAGSLAFREQRLMHTERLSTVGTLVAGVAHEINNPLTALRLNEELLLRQAREGRDTAEARGEAAEGESRTVRLHERNVTAIDRLAEISGALKDISRAKRRDRHPHDVNRLVNGCFMLAHHRFISGIQLHRDLGATRLVLCESGEISQVILNLLLNAADSVGADGEVFISTRDTAPDGTAHVVIDIRDTGPGVPDHIRAALFEPFVTTKRAGTGLGLSLCRRIVEAHGGEISLVSGTGSGATFRVILPATVLVDSSDAPLGELALRE